MKQKWINSRVKMLHEINKKHQPDENKMLIGKFLKKIQPDYPEKLHVEYSRQGAIPMGMADVYPGAIAMEMGSKNPVIPLKSKDEAMGEENKQ